MMMPGQLLAPGSIKSAIPANIEHLATSIVCSILVENKIPATPVPITMIEEIKMMMRGNSNSPFPYGLTISSLRQDLQGGQHLNKQYKFINITNQRLYSRNNLCTLEN